MRLCKIIWDFITDDKHSKGVAIVVPIVIASIAGIWAISSGPLIDKNEEEGPPPEFSGPEFHRFGDHLFGYGKLVIVDGKPLVNLEFSNGQRRDTVLRAEVVCIAPSGATLSRENVTVTLENSGGLASAYETTKDVYLKCFAPNSYKINWGQ